MPRPLGWHPLPNDPQILTRNSAWSAKESSLGASLIKSDESKKEDGLNIDMPSVWSRVRLTPLALGLMALVISAGVLGLGAGNAAAQTADTDADSYADDLEVQLGSSPTNPDSTPEHFALLWTCTDGNDNDKDGKRDFVDPGCRNTVPGSSPTPAPTPAPTQPPGGTGGGSSGGGSGGGGSSGSGGGSPSGSGSSGTDDNAVLGGSGVPIGGGTSDGGGSGSGVASETGGGAGDGSGTDTESAAADSTSADAAGAAGAGDQNASGQEGSDDGGFPWMISLLILLGGLIAAAICWALVGRSKARSRQVGAGGRF
jgi:hypothetical protein